MASPLYSGPITAATDASVGSAAVLASDVPCRAVVIQAAATNGSTIGIGDSASQPLLLAAGQSLSLRVFNLNQIYRVSTSGTQTLHWIVEH